jgi:hypothetical protein
LLGRALGHGEAIGGNNDVGGENGAGDLAAVETVAESLEAV